MDTQSSELAFSVHTFLKAIRSEGKSPNTLRFYDQGLASFASFLASEGHSLTLVDVLPSDARNFLASQLQRGLSPGTVDGRRRALVRFFNFLVEEGDMAISPMARVKRIKSPQQVVPSYSGDEIHTLLNNCSGKRFEDVRDKALILTFYDTGMRLGEVAGLLLDDVDWQVDRIKVRGKGAKERFAGMGSQLQRALLRWTRVRPQTGEGLWTNRLGHQLGKEAVRSIIKRRLRRVGIKGPRAVHRFRNSFAVQCLENGMHPDDLRELLGHTTDQMVRRYTQYGAQQRALRAHKNHSPADRL